MTPWLKNALSAHRFGPIADADLHFGDLTLLIGPQASGKSLTSQLLHLFLDLEQIAPNLAQHGFYWKQDSRNFITLYFGEGLGTIWNDQTRICPDQGEPFAFKDLAPFANLFADDPLRAPAIGRCLYIPAQRAIVLRDGWPQAFTDYSLGDPYVVKNFSEFLRLHLDRMLTADAPLLFPNLRRVDEGLGDPFTHILFHGAQLTLDTNTLRKRLMLDLHGNRLPPMVWSTGQREFIPLLLGLDWAMANIHTARWIVIEEPEMGMHPRGLQRLMPILLELLHRNCRLVISTHSPTLLELVWAIQRLREAPHGAKHLRQLLAIDENEFSTRKLDEILGKKTFTTYYFDRHDDGPVTVRDISSLDPGDEDVATADWGGLTAFASHASEVVSAAMAERE